MEVTENMTLRVKVNLANGYVMDFPVYRARSVTDIPAPLPAMLDAAKRAGYEVSVEIQKSETFLWC